MLIAIALSSIAQTTSSRGEAGNVRSGGFSSHKVNVPFGFETIRQDHQSLKVQRPLLARKKAVPTVVGDGTTLYGEVTYSTLMDDQTNPEDALKWGLYSFKAQSGTDFTSKLIHKSICANGGGTYANGKLYFTSYYEGMDGNLAYLYFCVLDLATMNMNQIALHSDYYTSIASDMTYDPVGNTIYSQAYPDDANTSTDWKYTLSTVNPATGIASRIAQLDRMSMIACDESGNLYGVRYNDGMFCSIDKQTAKVKEIGLTGVNPKYNASGTFDYKTGKLYWTTCERTTDQSGLYEIDPQTGAASFITSYPNNEMVSCLYIPQEANNFKLGEIADFTADFSNTASTTGSVSITAPSKDAAGNTITGEVTVLLYADGSLYFSKSCAPGATITEDVTLGKGAHVLEAVATHKTMGRTTKKQLNVWVGIDGPAAPANFKAVKLDDTRAKLTWDTPTIGAHGTAIKPALVYYSIYRNPGNELLTDEATDNEYIDKITNPSMRQYTYTIVPYYKNEEGVAAVSNAVEFGSPMTIPYKETFDTFDAYKTFIVYNANKDKGFWGWDQAGQCAKYQYDTFNAGDDWLISPALHMEGGMSYKLKFKAKSDSRLYPESMEIRMADAPFISSFNTVLMEKTEFKHEDYQEYEVTIHSPETNNYYIGFHAVSAKGLYWLYLDDIEIVAGPKTGTPTAITDLAAKQVLGGVQKAELSFTTPSTDMSGAPITSIEKVNIYRDNTLIHTINNPAVGAKLTYTDPAPAQGYNTYKVTCVNKDGEGTPAEVKIWVGMDKPCAPTNVVQTTTDNKVAHITWEAPLYGENGGTLNTDELTYNIYDSKERLVKKGVKGTSYTDNEIDCSKGQKTIFYYVQAVSAAGEGDGAGSNFITYGDAYKNGFKESFANGEFTTSDWIISVINPSPYNNDFYGRYWGTKHGKYDRGPKPEAQDGDNGMLIAYTDYIDVSSRLVSPRINVADMKNPVLNFWFYHYYSSSEDQYSHPNETMTVEVYQDGKYTEMLEKPIMLINGNGWYSYSIDLKKFVGKKDFQFAFKTHNFLSHDMHIDNITIEDVPSYDLAATSFVVPEKISAGSSRELTLTVANKGVETADAYSVEFLCDGKVFESIAADAPLAFAQERTFAATVAPGITEMGKTHTYSARIVFAKDENATNNTTEEIRSEVPANNLPVVNNLTLKKSDSGSALVWDEPEEGSGNTLVTEGFEGYEAFTITNMGDWKLEDVDRGYTYTIANSGSSTKDYDYPNAGEPMAFQVFNPSMINLKSKLWTPYLGNQMAVCFDSGNEVNNNDWLISPEVVGGTKVTFMAKSVTAQYGLEKMKFLYSTSDRETASFRQVDDVIAVPADKWTKYTFTLPEDAKYFAINCVSENSYALLLDEITYESTEPMTLSLLGFNVYRDGEKINSELLEEGYYVDTEAPAGEHYYNVTTVYDKGESAFSNQVSTTTGIDAVANGNVSVYTKQSTIYVKGGNGQQIRVYNVVGQCFENKTINSDNYATTLTPGIYMVSVGGKTTKVVLK